MTKATVWRTLFLGLTAVVIGLEVWGSFDGDDATDPWTDLIVRHVPGEITALLIAGLAGWLAVHFGLRYWRKHKAATVAEKEKADEPQD
ncbi:hypothetical protein AB0I28_12685 [Phytomonospora sp. NPDC050363]|uniref:hypothetical protein n=1 Tax=Phytomonospora sp. NPDC050363 TaxID=3155642 RepID=UPI0033F47D5D